MTFVIKKLDHKKRNNSYAGWNSKLLWNVHSASSTLDRLESCEGFDDQHRDSSKWLATGLPFTDECDLTDNIIRVGDRTESWNG